MNKNLTSHGNTPESAEWVLKTYENNSFYENHDTIKFWLEHNRKVLAEARAKEKTKKVDQASKIYRTLYPNSNFYSKSSIVQQKFIKAVDEIKRILNDD